MSKPITIKTRFAKAFQAGAKAARSAWRHTPLGGEIRIADNPYSRYSAEQREYDLFWLGWDRALSAAAKERVS